jgi:hypothetical protein
MSVEIGLVCLKTTACVTVITLKVVGGLIVMEAIVEVVPVMLTNAGAEAN